MIVLHDSCFACANQTGPEGELATNAEVHPTRLFQMDEAAHHNFPFKVPLLLDATRSDQLHNKPQESLESVSFVLPSDLLCALHEAGPQALP